MARLVLPATMDNFETIMEFVRQGARDAGLEPPVVNKIALASEEAIVNVIHYAYGKGVGDIEVTCETTGEGLVVTLRDRGVAFDPLAKAEPDIDAPVEERPIGGLGIFMVRKIMDKVTYKRVDGQNVLTMTKNK
jgi:serine/threonine-protein kinase RsbW